MTPNNDNWNDNDNDNWNDNDAGEADEEAVPPIPASMAVMKAQHGAAADKQLRGCGLSVRRQERMIEAGLLLRFARGVVTDPATVETWHRRAMAATLAPGAIPSLSGAAAARLHGADGFDDIERIIVSIPHGRRIHVAPGVTVVQARYLPPEDITFVDGIRVTTVAATLVSLARTRHPARAQALDWALRSGEDPALMREVFQRWRRAGSRGPTEMLQMLAERVDSRLPRSWFQRVAAEMLHEHGIELVEEWPVRDERGNLLAELDLANVELQVGLECQSWEWHGSPAAQDHDNVRKRTLSRLGWDIKDLWWSDLTRIDDVVADLLIALERARRLRT